MASTVLPVLAQVVRAHLSGTRRYINLAQGRREETCSGWPEYWLLLCLISQKEDTQRSVVGTTNGSIRVRKDWDHCLSSWHSYNLTPHNLPPPWLSLDTPTPSPYTLTLLHPRLAPWHLHTYTLVLHLTLTLPHPRLQNINKNQTKHMMIQTKQKS